MSAAIDGGVETQKSRGVFSRAFAKRAQPFEEGKFPRSEDNQPSFIPLRKNFPLPLLFNPFGQFLNDAYMHVYL